MSSAGTRSSDPWPTPWYPIEHQGISDVLERQLRLEVGPQHVLYGKNARLIARCDGTDDALFLLDDGRIADVHMTWRKSAEPDPRWPATHLFASLDDWRRSNSRAAEDQREP